MGQVSASLGTLFDFDYRFQLENKNFAAQRHQLNTNLNWDRLQLGTQYFYASEVADTRIDESREQIRPYTRIRFYDNWYFLGNVWYDLGRDPGLRQAVYGLDYQGQCMTFGLTTQRTFTRDSSGDSGTEIMARIGLKNLGQLQTSGLNLGGAGN